MSKYYSKEKIIGSGSFGNVWLVKSKTSNSYFVLKELNLSSMNATETQHALTEVTVLSRCRHRNIVRYKDAIIDHKKGLLSLIMEYAEGGDLYSAIINQEGVPFKEHTVLTWFTQISLALQYIHHKSILHRDLKTRNIFLTRDKQVKVGDFGISRCLMETEDLATTAIGTPYYLSPEICQRQPYSYKSDIWSLGCILFEMASLSHPFQACNFPHLLAMIITGQRKELPGNCSSVVKELVDHLLKENPEDRPTSDEILAMSSLQPYLSEVWVLQNTTTLNKKLTEKMNIRRSSSSNNGNKITAEIDLKRRASVSSTDARISKNKLGIVSRLKSVAVQKSSSNSRSHSLKEPKLLSKKTSIMSDPYSTYKISDSLLRTKKISINGLCFRPQKRSASRVPSDSNYPRDHDESDRGYQSEEILKTGVSGKFSEFYINKTSTKKNFDSPDFVIEESIFNDEVFPRNPVSRLPSSTKPASIGHDTSDCCHSQCQQCMLDMLWKNRIKGVIGPMTQTDQRTELIQKLQGIFGSDLFEDVYETMISNWEAGENNYSPKSIRDIARSLNYSQLQHLPLMMQLIQLDLIPK